MAPYTTSLRFPTAILAVNIIGLTLSFLSVVLRLWARHVRNVKWRLSDYTIIASWLFTFGLITSENYTITNGGVGQTTALVTGEQLLLTTKQFIVIGVTSSLAVALVKISILDFLLSIFAAHDRFRLPAYTLMAITAGYGISFAVGTLAGCIPFAANWDKISYPNYKCINTSQFYSAQTIIGAVLDFSVLLLPIPFVWNLLLPLRRKIALTFLFSIGTLVCVISLVRLVYNLNQTYMLTHFTEYAGIAVLLGSLEANLTIICACLPTFPAFSNSFSTWFKSTFSSNNGGLRKLISSFSSKANKPPGGSSKMTSSFVKLSDPEANNAERGPSRDTESESAKIQRQQDRLYPLSVTMATRPSLEGDYYGGSYQQGKNQTHITSNDVRHDPVALEMSNLGTAAEPQSSINVTRSWAVNQA
ncbi:hypothetical protein ONZ43_g6129 [Nemania bipapillata]|uniref:Uncharacterized protein n=1 Tax=Nemania bipapillata TaxID=110536 RepID=A0ACC2I2H4_9PEZI|nr:hypothetical protein ONZ43_g6129 [Nemania bipapillata]